MSNNCSDFPIKADVGNEMLILLQERVNIGLFDA